MIPLRAFSDKVWINDMSISTTFKTYLNKKLFTLEKNVLGLECDVVNRALRTLHWGSTWNNAFSPFRVKSPYFLLIPMKGGGSKHLRQQYLKLREDQQWRLLYKIKDEELGLEIMNRIMRKWDGSRCRKCI